MKHIASILLAVLPALVGRAQDPVPYMRGNIFYNVIPDWKKPGEENTNNDNGSHLNQ